MQESGFEREQLFNELPQDATIEAWHDEVEKLEQRIQRMGPINLAAIDEHKEQAERKEYLDSQHADLTEMNSVDFIEVHVATSLEECERRDTKGLYEKARQGIIKEFTGISDPYEEPENPEIILDTEKYSPEELVEQIIDYLRSRGIIEGKT